MIAVAAIGERVNRTRTTQVRALLLVACCPFFLNNVLYTWTKLLSGGFVAVAVSFHLAYRETSDPQRVKWTVLFLSFACGVHYSALPFAIAIAVDLLVLLRRRPRQVLNATLAPRNLSFHILTILAGIGIWLAWATTRFGLDETFGSTTSSSFSQLSPLDRILLHSSTSFLPIANFRSVLQGSQSRAAGLAAVRDVWFALTQHALFTGFGLFGFLVVLRMVHSGQFRQLLRPAFVVAAVSIPLALVSHPRAYMTGVAHVIFQPLLLLVLGLAAACEATSIAPHRKRLAAAATLDASFVLLNVAVLHQTGARLGPGAVDSQRILRLEHLITLSEHLHGRSFVGTLTIAVGVVAMCSRLLRSSRDGTTRHRSVAADSLDTASRVAAKTVDFPKNGQATDAKRGGDRRSRERPPARRGQHRGPFRVNPDGGKESRSSS
jgi:hypothetical protein